MSVLVINGSPKKKGSASAFFSKIFSLMLFPQKLMFKAASLSRNYEDTFVHLQNAEVVVISAPLYIDSIPSHLIHFLKQMEEYCVSNECKFMLYVISNAGFIEGRTNQAHLEQYKCWCQRANIEWGGGLGIGGAVMLHSIFYIFPLWSIIQFVIGIIINTISGNPTFNIGMLISIGHSMLIWLFFNIGLLFHTFIMAQAIKKKRIMKNQYTRAMVPSFIFLVFADIFMAISALFHGKMIFSLYKKEKCEEK